MGIFDRKWGSQRSKGPDEATGTQSADEQAIARYRYMLNTAPPEAIEQAHAEAFAQLTPEQRRQVLAKLAEEVPASERNAAEQSGADPQALARMATRAEIRQPGTLERKLGPAGGLGFGGMLAGSLLGSIAGTVLGSAIAREFFAHDAQGQNPADSSAEAGQEGASAESEQTLDSGGDFDAGTFDV